MINEVNKAEAYRPRQVAQMCNVSIDTVKRWMERGTVRPVKVGGTILIPRAEVERLLAGGAE